MRERWEQWVKWLDAQSERERAMVLVAGAVAICGIVYLIGIDPDLRRHRLIAARIIDQEAQIAAAEAQKLVLTQRLAQDPDAIVRQQIAEKQREIAEIDEQLVGLQRTLVAPDEMAGVVEQLVGRDRRVRLVSLHNLPATPLVQRVPSAETSSDEAAADEQRVYRHGVEVVVEGNYQALLAYVTRLERQPWQVYWGKTVMSAEYPKVIVSLTLYTLSLDRSWLMV